MSESVDRGEVTRRGLIGGGAAAGGLLVLGLPGAAEAQRRPRSVGTAPTDRHGVGFIVQIDQVGPSFTAFGYLTRIRGLNSAELFTRPPGKSTNDPRTADPSAARYTVFCQAGIQSLSTVGEVISTIAAGRLRLFRQPGGGARFEDPGSFARGTEIGSLDGLFQTNLALDAPDRAGVTLTADLTQRRVRTFTAQRRRVRLGGRRFAWGLHATGRGVRTERTTPRSRIFLTGELGVVDAVVRR